MSRRERQGAILRLVREREISTQSELAEALRSEGADVVQTTVSRDIAELGLVKVRAPSGKLLYAVPGTVSDLDRLRELDGAMRRWALTVGASGNLVLVNTLYGYASALAQVIDDTNHPHVLGTIGGENTVLIVAREGITGAALAEELRQHLPMEGAA